MRVCACVLKSIVHLAFCATTSCNGWPAWCPVPNVRQLDEARRQLDEADSKRAAAEVEIAQLASRLDHAEVVDSKCCPTVCCP
jgi:hypothetical protein